MSKQPEVKVYQSVAPFLAGVIKHGTWRIGPLHAWKVGDEVAIPERPPRYGVDRPGCERARVTHVHSDGMAECQDVQLIEEAKARTGSRYDKQPA
jgi:hypothetical protein